MKLQKKIIVNNKSLKKLLQSSALRNTQIYILQIYISNPQFYKWNTFCC